MYIYKIFVVLHKIFNVIFRCETYYELHAMDTSKEKANVYQNGENV
jgi:hypothetical protein